MNWEVRTMRSKTSFFNPTLFWKNVTRFWPVWALYTVIWVIVLPLSALNRLRGGWWSSGFHRILLGDAGHFGIPMAALFGILTAMALFSYLYQSRSACMVHSLPLRRECLFCTNYFTGLLFFLVPNTAVVLLTLLVELMAGDVSLWALGCWWLLVNGACLFFFSFAALCAQLTGHILALPALYGIFNVLVLGLYSVANWVLSESLFGFAGLTDSGWVTALTPLWGMMSAADWYILGDSAEGVLTMNDPLTYGLYAAAAVVMAVLALLLYLRRQVETAGDVVAVPWLRPVFKYGVAVCAGLAFGTATVTVVGLEGSAALWTLILLWAVVGYFVAEMLLKKSFRVFRAWKGAVAVALVVVIGYAGVELDLFGYETRVPLADRVESVTVRGLSSEPYDDGDYLNVQLTDPEDVALVTALHQAVVDQHVNGTDDRPGVAYGTTLFLDYVMKDGSTVQRHFNSTYRLGDLGVRGTTANAADALLNDRSVIRASYELDWFAPFEAQMAEMTGWDLKTGESTFTTLTTDPGQAQLLWEAVQADFGEGNLGTRYLFDTAERRENCCFNDLTFYLTWSRQGEDGRWLTDDRSFTVTLTPAAEHTIAALTGMGALEETPLVLYGDVVDFPSAEWEAEQSAPGTADGGAIPAGAAEPLEG